MIDYFLSAAMIVPKDADFERLWESKNHIKRERFRNWLMQKVRVRGFEPTKENCKQFYLGKLK